jgi:hypothetical protein
MKNRFYETTRERNVRNTRMWFRRISEIARKAREALRHPKNS